MGKSLIDLIYDTHENREKRAVLPYSPADEQYQYWKNSFNTPGSPMELFKDVISRSIIYQNPNYMGHQTAVPAMSSILASLVVDYLNNAMGVYEMGMVGNAMERVVAEHLCEKFELGKNAGGFFTSGGTLGTLTAIMTAKANYLKNNSENDKLCILTSEEAHYCVERAALTMGLGHDGVIKVPVDDEFKMDIEQLKKHYQLAVKEGKKVFCIIGSAPSTSTGAYDDLEAIGNFCEQNNIWFHVDGAHGAGVIFSSKYKHLVKGIEKANSIVMDFHKMLLTPSLCTAVLLKDLDCSYDTFRQKADYLWQKQDNDWSQGAKKTFETTKSMYILKVFVLFKEFGDDVFEKYIDNQYSLAREFTSNYSQNNNFEFAYKPHSNIVCFRYINCENINEFNSLLSQQITKEGSFYLGKTILNGKVYLRIALMNYETAMYHIEKLINTIEEKAEQLKATKHI
jgi:L-2,4-diaminobutyrate decarboxylase